MINKIAQIKIFLSDQSENSDMCNARKWYQRCGTSDDPKDISNREESCVSNHPHVVRLIDKAQEYPIKPLECNNEMQYGDVFNCQIKAVEEFPQGLDPGVPSTCCIEFQAKYKFQKGKEPHFTIFCSTIEKSQKCQDQIKTIWHLLGTQCGEMNEQESEQQVTDVEEDEEEEKEDVDLGPQVVDPYFEYKPEILQENSDEDPLEYEIKDGESINIISSPQPLIDEETEYNEIKGIKEDETSIDKKLDIDNDGNIETTITGQTLNPNDPDAAAAMKAMEEAQQYMRKSQQPSNDLNEMRKSKIGTLKTDNKQFDLYYPFDSNVAASLMAPPLLPPNQLNSSDTKTMPTDEVKTQAYLNILPHPATHTKEKADPKAPKVDNLMQPFIGLLPNPVINLQANTIIPPFLAKKLVAVNQDKNNTWSGKDNKVGGPQLSEEIIEWMHTKGIEYKGPKLEDNVKDNRDKSPQPEFLILPLPLPNDKEPPKPYLIQPLSEDLQVNAEHNVPNQPFLGLPAPSIKGDPTDLHPFIAIPTTLLFSEQIRLKQSQEHLSLDQLMQKIKDDSDDECSDSYSILDDPKLANGIAQEIEEQTLDQSPKPKDLSPAELEKAKGVSGKSLFGKLYGLDDVKQDQIKAGQNPFESPNKGRLCEINIAFRYS